MENMDEIENGIAPEVETQEPAVNDAPEQATGEVEQEKPQAEVPEWAKKRFGELTAKRHAAEQRAAQQEENARQLQAKLEALQAGNQGENQPQGDIHQLAQAYAKQIADQQLQDLTFNQRCNAVAEEGKKNFGDFQTSLDNLNQYFGLSREFLDVATNVDGADKVLYYLGKPENFDKFEKISGLPPVKQAIELTKLVSVASKALQKPVSNAPAPVEPIGGKGSADGVPDISDTKAWIEYRNKNAKRRR